MLMEDLIQGAFDFVDFGCSNGDSLKFGFEKFGARRGLGLDINSDKVKATIEKGYEALLLDATTLENYRGIVSFSIMSHFLEHLSGYRMARKCITAAMTASRDFVLIKQPWFDSDGYLFDKGLKFYWSDWRGHDFTMTSLQVYRAIRDSGLNCRFRFYGRRRVYSSDDLAIHPVGSSFDQHAYSSDRHGDKEVSFIGMPTFYELQCVILRSDEYSFESIEKHLGGGHENLLFEGVC